MELSEEQLLQLREAHLANQLGRGESGPGYQNNRSGMLSVAIAMIGIIVLPTLSFLEGGRRHEQLARSGHSAHQIDRQTRGIFGVTYADVGELLYFIVGYPVGGLLAVGSLIGGRQPRWLGWAGLIANSAPYAFLAWLMAHAAGV